MKLERIVLSMAMFAGLSLAPALAIGEGNSDALLPVLTLAQHFDTFPVYYQQSIDGSTDYSAIEAYVREESKTYFVLLTDTATGERTCYTNTESAVRFPGVAANCLVTAIDYHKPEAIYTGSAAGVALRDKHGVAIRWRFLFAYQVTEMGGGVTPQPAPVGLTLIYRKRGTVAAEGSAVEIAGKVYAAGVWKEISNPPYFVAYHGYYAEQVSISEIGVGKSEWKLAQSDAQDVVRLTSNDGQTVRVFRKVQAKDKPNTWTFQSDDSGQLASSVAVVHGDVAGSESVETLTAGDPGHAVKITFHPALPLTAPPSSALTSQFIVDQDGQKDIAHGTVRIVKSDDGYQLVWSFGAPDWARAQHVTQKASLVGAKLTLVTE